MTPQAAPQDTALLSLVPEHVDLAQLFLDPGNPRLMSLREDAPDGFTDQEIVDPQLQEQVLTKLAEDRIGLTDLIAKIRTNGFLAIDRIVIKPLLFKLEDDRQAYLVLEGNRRLGALKTITKTPSLLAGITDAAKKSYASVDVLVYTGSDADVAWHIQGLRHIEGIKEWGPFQKARYLHDTRRDAQQLRQQTGISVMQINRLLRSYSAFQQALLDEDWGDTLQEDDFAVFNEGVFAKPSLQAWLGWDDRSKKFTDADNFKTLLRLRKEVPEDATSPRIPKVNPDLRDRFAKLLESKHKGLLDRFLNDDLPLEKAYAQALQDEAGQDLDVAALLEMLRNSKSVVSKLPVLEIMRDEPHKAEFVRLLRDLREDCAGQIQLLSAQLAAED